MDQRDGVTGEAEHENAGSRYEPPRVITHSAAELDGLTIHVNACTSAFGAKSSDKAEDGSESVTY